MGKMNIIHLEEHFTFSKQKQYYLYSILVTLHKRTWITADSICNLNNTIIGINSVWDWVGSIRSSFQFIHKDRSTMQALHFCI